jgi:hypothetical protein
VTWQGRVPAPIVIHEDEPAGEEAEVPEGPAHGDVECLPRTPEGTGEQPPACPLVMPYCEDEELPPAETLPMPRAEEDEGGEHCDDNIPAVFRFWMECFKGPSETKGGTETAEPAKADDVPRCEEDRHYYEHYSGCPYTGCRKPPQGPPAAARPPAPAKGRGQDECSEEPPAPGKAKHKANYHGKGKSEDCPAHPEVDTMEYRKSDGGLNEYGPGPF